VILLALAIALGEVTPHAQTPRIAKTIVIHARKYAFVPNAITLRKDETVKLILISDDVHHSLSVRGLGIRSDIKPGQPADVLVTPTTAGDFPGTCSFFCGSGHRDMEFMVHVVE
jgi:cytochrome c oxidase subunit II